VLRLLQHRGSDLKASKPTLQSRADQIVPNTSSLGLLLYPMIQIDVGQWYKYMLYEDVQEMTQSQLFNAHGQLKSTKRSSRQSYFLLLFTSPLNFYPRSTLTARDAAMASSILEEANSRMIFFSRRHWNSSPFTFPSYI